MSDLGLLSYQYQELANLARQLKQWAVPIKCAYHHLPFPETDAAHPNLSTAVAEMEQIARFLSEVIVLEDEGAWPEKWLADPPLPTLLVERLRNAHAYELPLYVQQLSRLSEHLHKGVESLTARDVSLLDNIVLAADADVNAVFRRLMRWA
jgi:hypothetical protein